VASPVAPVAVTETVPALEALRGPLNELLDRFLDDRVAELATIDAGLVPVAEEVAAFIRRGGKRLRPAFTYWGHRATGAEHDPVVLAAAGAVELLHSFALIHDDVMDRSLTRRGWPTMHEALAAYHRDARMRGDDRWFGVGAAILAGDLAFVWADQLFDSVDLPAEQHHRARRVFTELRVEVMAGQYLDLRLSGLPDATPDDALRVALLKSGRYTATRPLQLGAAIGGATADVGAVLADYGDAVGVAFQLRDDVLGLFGDPATTGKGAQDDLREGKRTLLILRAMELVGPAERAELANVERRIIAARQDIRALHTELGTRGRLTQLERWNQDVLALSAPTAGQFMDGAYRLASLDVRGDSSPVASPVRMASAELQSPVPSPAPAARLAVLEPAPEQQSPIRRASLIVQEPSSGLAVPQPAAAQASSLLDEDTLRELRAAATRERAGGPGN
jgi:geranylgeranyl diphosphate synthase, type I